MNDTHKAGLSGEADHPAATPDFWSTRWRAGQIGFHREEPNEHLVAEFDRVFTTRGRVLLPLCGKSVDLSWLGHHFEEVVGIEFVPQAAHDFAAESGRDHRHGRWDDGPPSVTVDNVHIVIDDFFACGPDLLGRFDAAYDRAALIAIPPSKRAAYVAHLASFLTSGGRALILTLDYPPALRQGPPFAISDDDMVALWSPHGTLERLSHGPTREHPSGLPADTTVTTSTFCFTRTASHP